MRSYNILYSKEAIQRLPIEEINNSKSILIQIFTTIAEEEELRYKLKTLERYFPKAKIIGTTTAGNIIGGKLEDSSSVISVTTFEKTSLKLLHIDDISYENSFEKGEYFSQNLISKKTKALIIFGDNNTINAQAFINGIKDSSKEDIVIAGGIAGITPNGEGSLLVSNEKISSKGVAAVAIDSNVIRVENHFKNDWVAFGKKLVITHAKGNRVYSIDHMPAIELFKHYLGDDIYEDFTNSKLLFPLISTKESIPIARTVIKKYDDGSLGFAGEMKTGEVYQIGFGNLEQMLQNNTFPMNKSQKHSTESIFVYSCVARRKFMKNEIIKEITPLNDVADVSGFFTYGEFYSDNAGAHFMNQTITVLSLSESPCTKTECNLPRSNIETNSFCTFSALSHLISVTNNELREYHAYLDQKEQLLCGGPVVNFKISFDEKKRASCTYISQNINQLLGYSTKELINSEVSLEQIFEIQTLLKLQKEISAYKHNNEISYETEVKVRTKYADIKYLHIYLTMQKNHDFPKNDLIGYCIDITKQVKSQEKIKKLAFYDNVTGLANRELLKIKFEQKVKEAKALGRLCAVSFFDLDKFKDVNDTYGHSIGDKLLKLIANRLNTVIKNDDFIARIGGDEFVLIHGNLNPKTVQTNIFTMVNRIITLIEEPFSIDNKIIHISTSIGTAIYGIDGDNTEDLIKHADMAMYEAKNDSHVNFKFYSHTMRILREKELVIQEELKKAVKNREFTILYQPQVDTQNGHIVGAEALIRWEHPHKGTISPVIFIPIAEETNLIIDMGEWIINEVCHKIKHLQSIKDLPKEFKTLSVNISPIQFKDPYFISKVKKIVTLLKIDTSFLEFELTEGVFSSNIKEIIEKMHQLKEMGITISLDDFGTGYSSLQYLKDLPIDTVKIDRAFISNVQNNKDDQLLASTIIQLSKNMQCKIIAEGVENIEQLAFLEENDCSTYQGFYFSKPIAFEELKKLLTKQKASASLTI